MKKLILILSLTFISISAFKANAQVSLNINVGSQPQWGPAGYDHVDYYYLPDIETYYYVPKKQFVYLENNNWVFRNTLPTRYASYNLYNGYKVVLNKPRPYLNFKNDKAVYAKYKGNRGQASIKAKNVNFKGGNAKSNNGHAVKAKSNNGKGNKH